MDVDVCERESWGGGGGALKYSQNVVIFSMG